MIAFKRYLEIVADRPAKLSAVEVGFKRGAGKGSSERCANCHHFYVNPSSPRKVCEIFRPSDDSSILPTDRCRFFNRDFSSYPLLDSDADEREYGDEKEDERDEEDDDGSES